MGTDTCLPFKRTHMVKVVTAADFTKLEHLYMYLLTGRCYEAEICAILLPLRCPLGWYPFFKTFFGLQKTKPWTIVHGFRPENENFEFGKKMISSERASQEEQNGANFSFLAPSSAEVWLHVVFKVYAW